MAQPDLDSEEGKLSLLLWAMKRHQGELRMFGGIWKKHSSGEIPKGADQQFKLTPEEILALSAGLTEQDHIDPVIYSALEIRAQVNRGERPASEQVVGIFWAKGDGVFWTRQTRTWDLPSLTGVYAHRFTFKYIDAAQGPQCGGLDLGQVDGQHPPDEEGGGALPGEPGNPQAAQQGGMELHLQGGGNVSGQEFHR